MMKIKKCHIILSSLLPDPSQDVQDLAKYINKKLHTLSLNHLNTSFMNLDKKFYHGHWINIDFYKKDFIHLNRNGSKTLAKYVCKTIKKIKL